MNSNHSLIAFGMLSHAWCLIHGKNQSGSRQQQFLNLSLGILCQSFFVSADLPHDNRAGEPFYLSTLCFSVQSTPRVSPSMFRSQSTRGCFRKSTEKANSIIPTDGGWIFEPVHCSISWGETFFWVEAAEYSPRLPFSYFLKYMLAVSLYQMNLFITFLSKTTIIWILLKKKSAVSY